MLYTLHIRPLGEVILHLDSISIDGFKIFITGYDNDHNRIDFTMDKLCYLEDSPDDYGYCHIISYVKGGVHTACNVYKPLM